MGWRIIEGNSAEALRAMADDSVDALVTDPPAGISFMQRAWDSDKGGRDQWIAWLAEIMREARRVLKPGAHGLVWALPRTSHWTAMALELAGFEIRDRVSHLFSTGFPKSLSVPKAIDAHLGAEQAGAATWAARQWDGWGTALKPACEDWWLVRKPLAGTVAANVLAHGTGAMNIDGCRLDPGDGGARNDEPSANRRYSDRGATSFAATPGPRGGSAAGRWPANVVLSHNPECTDEGCAPGCAVAELDRQSGESVSIPRIGDGEPLDYYGDGWGFRRAASTYTDRGPASRFFYVPKPARSERERGCKHLEARTGAQAVEREEGSAGLANPRAGAGRTAKSVRNHHPTVKPVALMRWLCRLITPPGGLVLDPFCGSGSTGVAALEEGFDFVGVEKDPEYVAIARARLAAAQPHQMTLGGVA